MFILLHIKNLYFIHFLFVFKIVESLQSIPKESVDKNGCLFLSYNTGQKLAGLGAFRSSNIVIFFNTLIPFRNYSNPKIISTITKRN